MLSYAIDDPAPSTIFLITGDRDFAYALSILKNRHYKVILVKRPDTHVSLTFQACICFDWYDDIVHQAENPSFQAEQRTQRPYQRHRQFSDPIGNALSSRPLPWHPATEGPIGSRADTEGTVDITHYLRERISDRLGAPPALQDHPQVSTAIDQSPRQDQAISPSPKHRRGLSLSTSRDSTSNLALPQEKQQTSFKTSKHPSTQPETPCIVLPLPCKDDSPVIKGMPSVKLVKLEPSYPTPASLSADTGEHKAINKASGTFPKHLEPTRDVLFSIPPLLSPVMLPAPTLPMTPNPIGAQRFVPAETNATLHPVAPTIPPEGLAEKFLKKELTNNITPSSPNLATSSQSPKPSTSVDTVEPSIECSVATSAKAADPSNSNLRVTPQTTSGPGQSTGPLDTPVVPAKFVVLVEALQSDRSRGIFLPLRSIISVRINKKGATYRNAGVSSFRHYCLLAEQEGIVDLGGMDGRDWIRLKPKWYNAHTVAPTIPSSCS